MQHKLSTPIDVVKQIALPIVLVVLADQLSKYFVMEKSIPYILNSGIIGGAFSHAPPVEKSIIIFSLFFVLLTVFTFFQFLFFKSLKLLSVLGSTLIAAFGSNLIDKWRWAGVIDFIPIQLTSDKVFMLNIADVIQQISLVSIFVYLAKNHKTIWPLINFRKSWIIDFQFQIESALFTSTFTVLTGAAISVISRLAQSADGVSFGSGLYWGSVGFFLLFLFLLTFGLSLIFFHRAAGPVFSANRFIDRLSSGEYGSLKFRRGDYFKKLETSLNRLSEVLNRPKN